VRAFGCSLRRGGKGITKEIDVRLWGSLYSKCAFGF
jgi:hypothetical protein